MNTYVNFELAKLLKEKGFDKICKKYYPDDGSLLISNKGSIRHIAYRIQAPTIADVVMWLYEKHGIWIEVVYRSKLWGFSIKNIKTDLFELERLEYGSLTEAYEEAIEYILKNLIDKF